MSKSNTGHIYTAMFAAGACITALAGVLLTAADSSDMGIEKHVTAKVYGLELSPDDRATGADVLIDSRPVRPATYTLGRHAKTPALKKCYDMTLSHVIGITENHPVIEDLKETPCPPKL